MILEYIELENVRSYNNARINFPDGSLLLSGDIGAGKSTILLGIEFALFGIKRDLPGEALLKHGKNNGSVELKFSIGKDSIVIKRNLKRTKDSVAQESGYIIVNNVKKDLTPVELKSKVLHLLGYPEELLTKSKSLIYRYTVYTPQEQMKQILFEEKEARLETLRKVFGIDKYKTIRNNIELYVRELKRKKAEYLGKISDLEEKQKQKNSREKEIETLAEHIERIEPELEKIKEKITEKRKEVDEIEHTINLLNKLKNEYSIFEVKLQNNNELRKRHNNNIIDIELQLTELKKDVKDFDEKEHESVRSELKSKEEQLEKEQDKLDVIRKAISDLDAKKENLEENLKNFSGLDICPVCKQKVSEEHKHSISSEEEQKIINFDGKLKEYREKDKLIRTEVDKLKIEIPKLRQKERLFGITAVKLRNVNEKEKQKEKLLLDIEELDRKLNEISSQKNELAEKIKGFENLDSDYKKLKDEMKVLTDEEKRIEFDIVKLKKQKDMVLELIEDMKREIDNKLKAKEKLNYLNEMQQWLEEYFSNLMSLMEKQVMFRIYNEFNDLLKEWFGVLIEDEVMSIRIDEEFTPIVDQDGYETEIENLSGGEKTAVALAYRLALNKVINDLISGIKTKDLIILDEPTDGFSSEQLDRVKNVLDELKIKQVIIVSHESKIETFVDNVIRIGKVNNISSITSS